MANSKKMDVQEFREKGYLQELNRRFLHPLGLAIEVKINEDGTEELSGIWDNRQDMDGIEYGLRVSKPERIEKFEKNKKFIDEEMENRCKYRKEKLGFDIEPI